MISPLNPSARQFLNALNRIGDRMDRAQRQVSTGLKLGRVSDEPDQVATLLQARADLDSAQQTQANLGRVKTEVDTAEQTLQSAVQLFEHARTLGAQGATDIQTAAERGDLATEIGSVLEQMSGLAGTSTNGRYIFSGDSDQQAPYAVDLTQATPVSTYQGSAATRQVRHPNGTTFSVSLTAQQIFDSADPTTNVFGALTQLRSSLLANDSAAIQTAVDAMPKAGEYLNTQLAFYGTAQNRVSEATDFGTNLQVQLQTQISGIQDADLSEAILELNQAQTQQQAALQSRAQLPLRTLFDYLA